MNIFIPKPHAGFPTASTCNRILFDFIRNMGQADGIMKFEDTIEESLKVVGTAKRLVPSAIDLQAQVPAE
nr:hypothetical protein [uncultured Rhodopila sp.]